MKIKTCGKRILCAVLTVIMALSAFPFTVTAHQFTDVTEYSDAIDALTEVGIITGYDENTFRPDESVTRWQMALLVAKLHSGDCRNDTWVKTAAGYSFTDVEEYQYKSAIKYCYDYGFICGRDEEGKIFDPKGLITLQEAITLIIRVMGYSRDTLDAEWPVYYNMLGTNIGLCKGLENVAYTDSITRGQAAQIIYNCFYLKRPNSSSTGGALLPSFAESAYTVAGNKVNKSMKYYILSSVENELVFNEISLNGTISNSYIRIPSVTATSVSSVKDFSGYEGAIFGLIFKGNDLIICEEIKYKEITTGLEANSAEGTLKISGKDYTITDKFSGNNNYNNTKTGEIIIYSSNSIFTSNGFTTLKISDIAGTNCAYILHAYDLDGNGTYDFANYSPYRFGKLITSELSFVGFGYYLYSYDVIRHVVTSKQYCETKTGHLDAINLINCTCTIDGTVYPIGIKNLPGADLMTVIASLAEVEGIDVTYVIYNGAIVKVY